MEYNLSIDSHIGPWGYSKNYIRSQMSGFKNKPVNVRVSSLGGAVDDALDIRQQFKDRGNAHAIFSAMWRLRYYFSEQGREKDLYVSRYAFYLIHKVSNWIDAWGSYNADQIQQLIDDLKANKLEMTRWIWYWPIFMLLNVEKVGEILPILKESQMAYSSGST